MSKAQGFHLHANPVCCQGIGTVQQPRIATAPAMSAAEAYCLQHGMGAHTALGVLRVLVCLPLSEWQCRVGSM